MAFIDIIFLAALAIFLGYRLWSLLGTHDPARPLSQKKPLEDDIIASVRRSPSSSKTMNPPSSQDVETQNDSKFLKGATVAFQQIVEAYAEGNLSVLERLLQGPLFDTFKDAVEKRNKENTTLEVDINRISSATILKRWEEKRDSYVTVRFVSQQCLVTRNKKGAVLTGDPDRYIDVTDIWTFTRPLKNSNPNWKLVATQLPEISNL